MRPQGEPLARVKSGETVAIYAGEDSGGLISEDYVPTIQALELYAHNKADATCSPVAWCLDLSREDLGGAGSSQSGPRMR